MVQYYPLCGLLQEGRPSFYGAIEDSNIADRRICFSARCIDCPFECHYLVSPSRIFFRCLGNW